MLPRKIGRKRLLEWDFGIQSVISKVKASTCGRVARF